TAGVQESFSRNPSIKDLHCQQRTPWSSGMRVGRSRIQRSSGNPKSPRVGRKSAHNFWRPRPFTITHEIHCHRHVVYLHRTRNHKTNPSPRADWSSKATSGATYCSSPQLRRLGL
ncbi:unnamed protein product, partial [Ectocarpus sp. 12 AP-2014]